MKGGVRESWKEGPKVAIKNWVKGGVEREKKTNGGTHPRHGCRKGDSEKKK